MKLYDPYNVGGANLAECERKISRALAVLALSPENFGHPLLYGFAAGKQHILTNSIKTAGTNGTKFYWNVKFLLSLSNDQVLVVFKHECYHGLLCHCEFMKTAFRPRVANIAHDFIVNAMIDKEWRRATKNEYKEFSVDNHPLWRYPLGKPMSLEHFIEVLNTDKEDLLKNLKNTIDRVVNKGTPIDASGQLKENPVDHIKNNYCLMDPEVLKRGSNSVYNELNTIYNKLDSEVQDLFDEFSFDEHMPSDRESKKALEDLLKAVNFAKSQRGFIPDEVAYLLKELYDPTQNLLGFLNHAVKKNKINSGKKASYTRFKKRFISEDLFYPQYCHDTANILVLLDTSASMSDNDIAAGVSELQQFIGKAQLFIVPVDATPHWNRVSKVNKQSDFKKVEVVGRGGTVFQDFFKNYRKQLSKYGSFCSILVITDGEIDIIPPEYSPPCDVGWLFTNSEVKFEQSFGKVVRLK